MEKKAKKTNRIEHHANLLNRLAQSKSTYENGVERLYVCYKNSSLTKHISSTVLKEIEGKLRLRMI